MNLSPLLTAHEADAKTVTAALANYRRALAAIDPNLRADVLQDRRRAARAALDESIKAALPSLRARRSELAEARAKLADPQVALVLAAQGRAGDVAMADLLAAQALPGLSDAGLLVMAESAKPGVLLSIRQEIARRAQAAQGDDARAALEVLAQVDDLAARHVHVGAVQKLAQAERAGIEAELAHNEAVDGGPVNKLALARELAALPAAE